MPNETATAAPLKVISVAIGLIRVDAQARKKFDDAAIKELASNIKTLGVINPVTLRAGENLMRGQYLLVSGERRVRAAKLAGLIEIPARILELDDQQALEYQAAENIHRKDLTPIEEARAFKSLLDAKRYTVEQLSGLVDKSHIYVYRSIRLLELPPKVVDAIESEELTPAHGHQILRAPKEAWEKMVEFSFKKQYDGRLPTALQLAGWINENTSQSLQEAGFPKDRLYADMPSCTDCAYNSENHGTLFPDAEGGSCTNGKCYQAKMKKHYWDLAEAESKKYKGLKYVGAGAVKGYGDEQTIKGGLVLTKAAAALAEIKKALRSEPDKFGVAVTLRDPEANFKPRAVVVVLDEELKKKLLPKRGQEISRDYQRDNHISRAVLSAQALAALKALKGKALPKEARQAALNDMLEDNGHLTHKVLAEAWGDKVKAIDADDMMRLFWFRTVLDYNDIDAKACAWLKVDFKGIAKATTKAAAAEYDAAKKAEAAAPKKDEKSDGSQEDGNE